MKRLILLGYAPAEKVAWPCGSLGTRLQPLDPRHGVFPNLVMTPLFSALNFLAPDEGSRFLKMVHATILDEGNEARRPLRFNVLANDLTEPRQKKESGEKRRRRKRSEVQKKRSKLSSCVRDMIAFPEQGSVANATIRICPGKDLCLVFNYWSLSAILAYLARGEPREGWSVDDLKPFSAGLLTRLLDADGAYIRRLLGLANGLPERTIPKLGIYSRLFARTADARVRRILIDSLFAEYHAAIGSAPNPAAVRWMSGVLESILPLPHNEIYQSYKETTNPIGKYQASFLRGQDPEELKAQDPPEILWKYVGRSIAQKLAEAPWPQVDLQSEAG